MLCLDWTSIDFYDLQQWLLLCGSDSELHVGEDLIPHYDNLLEIKGKEAKALSSLRLSALVIASFVGEPYLVFQELARRTPVLSALQYLECRFVQQDDIDEVQELLRLCGSPVGRLALDFYDFNMRTSSSRHIV